MNKIRICQYIDNIKLRGFLKGTFEIPPQNSLHVHWKSDFQQNFKMLRAIERIILTKR